MKAILIDPSEGSVRKIKWHYKPLNKNANDIRNFLQCTTFAGVGFSYNKKIGTIFHDDEGLFTRPVQFFYINKLYPMPIPGKGLIVGADEDGETVDIPKKLESDLLNGVASVTFPTFDEVCLIERNLMMASGY